ncbi:MAG: TrmH family RNA methyltransferase, partial [Perlucidibaca sp.]
MSLLTKAEQKRLRELHAKKGRREQGAFLVEGGKSVAELLASDWPVLAVYATPEAAQGLHDAAVRRGLGLVEVNASQLTSLGTYEHNDSAIAVAGLRAWPQRPPRPGELMLALDDIRDPGNLGTILRLADWYGVSQVVCSPATVEWQNPKAIAASMGSFLRVPVVEAALPAWLAGQRAAGVAVAGAVLDGESTHALAAPFTGGVLVIGSESHGLSDA